MDTSENDFDWVRDFIVDSLAEKYYRSCYLLKYLTDYKSRKERQRKRVNVVFTLLSAFGIVGWFNLPDASNFWALMMGVIHGLYVLRNYLLTSEGDLAKIGECSNSILVYKQQFDSLAERACDRKIDQKFAGERLDEIFNELEKVSLTIASLGDLSVASLKPKGEEYAEHHINELYKKCLK